MKFEAKVKYHRIDPASGKEKQVSQDYILEAETFGQAEEDTLKAMAEITPATVAKAIKISDVAEIIESEGDNFYKVKVMVRDIDELSGKEKDSPTILLIRSNTVKFALKLAEEWQDGIMADTELHSIRLVTIIDQLPFQKEQVKVEIESSSADAYNPAYDADLEDESDADDEDTDDESA
jgi:hypothetical protein